MQYGAILVRGGFGAGKSYYTHRQITGKPLLPFGRGAKVVRIGNYTSPDFDIEFRSVSDLISLLIHIYRYKKDPSTLSTKIIIVVDEAPLYFNSRDFKNFPKELYPFLNQLRKLNVSLVLITQKPDQIDAMIRRVVSVIYDYQPGIKILRLLNVYESYDESCNILDPVSTKLLYKIPKFGPTLQGFIDSIITSIGLNYVLGSTRYDTSELILPHLNMITGDPHTLLPIDPLIDSMSFEDFYSNKREIFRKQTPYSLADIPRTLQNLRNNSQKENGILSRLFPNKNNKTPEEKTNDETMNETKEIPDQHTSLLQNTSLNSLSPNLPPLSPSSHSLPPQTLTQQTQQTSQNDPLSELTELPNQQTSSNTYQITLK